MANDVDEAGRLSGQKLVWVSGLAALISFLVTFSGGVAFKSYHGMRNEPDVFPATEWWLWLLLLSLGIAVAMGALTLSWRLIYRYEGETHWGTALAVVGIALFAFLVWPTPWAYRRFGCDVYRISRLRGDHEYVTRMPACEPAPAEDTPAAGGS